MSLRAWGFIIPGTSCQISMHSGQWFMRRNFFDDLTKHFPYFAPYWAPKGASPYI